MDEICDPKSFRGPLAVVAVAAAAIAAVGLNVPSAIPR
jgi:hypothetical protein